ncbi:hypothetical protein [Nocardia africana]
MTDPDDGVLEARIPNLNPWAGIRVLALHSHTAEQACDETCSIYDRNADYLT